MISNSNQQVLFSRKDLDEITERFATYIVQRRMPVDTAWKQAVEDQAELVEHKLELMEEGALIWDWPSLQLDAMRREQAHRAEHRELAAQ